jgi:TRAP-type mannitol/chloroaromatic compound transport system substrate-binding protein
MTDLRKAAEAATPGPWKTHLIDDTTIVSDRVDVATTCDSSNVERSDSYNNDFERMEADAAYIAAANPQAILALLDERDALTARVAALEAENKKLRETLKPFAEEAQKYKPDEHDKDTAWDSLPTIGDLRQAALVGGKNG